jgi:hypothetical protein
MPERSAVAADLLGLIENGAGLRPLRAAGEENGTDH